jgi:hypothetical protein
MTVTSVILQLFMHTNQISQGTNIHGNQTCHTLLFQVSIITNKRLFIFTFATLGQFEQFYSQHTWVWWRYGQSFLPRVCGIAIVCNCHLKCVYTWSTMTYIKVTCVYAISLCNIRVWKQRNVKPLNVVHYHYHLLFTSINPIRSTNSRGWGNRLGYKLVQGATCRTIIEH